MVRRYRPPGSPPPVPRRRPRYTGRPDGPWNIGLFAGYDAGFAPQEGDGWDPAWELTSHGPNDDASGAGEDTVPDDGDDQANQGAVRKPTGRPAARSSRSVRPSSVRKPQDLSRGRQRCLAEDTRREQAVPRAQALLPWGARIPPGGGRPAAAFRRPDGPEYEWAALASCGPEWTESAETAAAAQ